MVDVLLVFFNLLFVFLVLQAILLDLLSQIIQFISVLFHNVFL